MPIYQNKQVHDWDGNYLGEQQEEVYVSILSGSGSGSCCEPCRESPCGCEAPECDPTGNETGHSLVAKIDADPKDGQFQMVPCNIANQFTTESVGFGAAYFTS